MLHLDERAFGPDTALAEPSMRILVVEDDPSVAQVLAEVLRVEGHDVLVALDGVEALNVVERTTVDGVFLDLVMPGLDGLSVLSRIRSRFPDLPVVILSAHAESEATHRARELGAADILTKPSALRDLTEVLRHFTSP
jgi:CheY-like chemotaxis protein